MNQTFLVEYCVLLAVLLGLSFYFPKIRILAYITVTGMFILASTLYFTMENYKGWPTDTEFNDVSVIAIDIQEPNQEANFEGAIYVWLQEKVAYSNELLYNPGNNVPRAHYIKYTEQSSKSFAKAKDLLKRGYAVTMGKKSKELGEVAPRSGDFDFEYEKDKPIIQAINPQNLMQKTE